LQTPQPNLTIGITDKLIACYTAITYMYTKCSCFAYE